MQTPLKADGAAKHSFIRKDTRNHHFSIRSVRAALHINLVFLYHFCWTEYVIQIQKHSLICSTEISRLFGMKSCEEMSLKFDFVNRTGNKTDTTLVFSH